MSITIPAITDDEGDTISFSATIDGVALTAVSHSWIAYDGSHLITGSPTNAEVNSYLIVIHANDFENNSS